MAPEPLTPRILITAGPTHEPIDGVRYLANRSSGRLGVALADAAGERGHPTTLLLGPTHLEPSHTRVVTHRFRTAADLQALLADHFPACDILIMAAAVADYRAAPNPPYSGGLLPAKLKRGKAPITLTLEPTPDLLGELAGRKRPDQITIGFALEPGDRLEASAREKLARKRLDAIVANPLETMDAEDIEATIFTAAGDAMATPGVMPKQAFGVWLLERVLALAASSD
jgi:phosphopantothenoylcysteine decarboxylase/phosphopantothenate--cysteine ligase